MKARYREKNIVYKRRYAFHIGIFFPSTYKASLSSLALQVLYYSLNQYPEVYAERIVYEPGDHRSIETGTAPDKFDLLMAMTSYELDYPVIAKLAKETKRKPYLLVGGPSPSANPSSLYRIADAVYRGEIEEDIPILVDAMGYIDDRRMFEEKLADIKGIWIPGVKEEAEISKVRSLDAAVHPVRQIQSLDEEPVYGRSLLVEPSRGCNRGCRFCLEGNIYRPRRERSLGLIKEIISKGLELNNLEKVSFYTLSFFDSPQGEKLLEYLVENDIEGSIPSVRADALTEYRVELVRKVGQRVLTIAPETPSRKLQLVLGKSISSKVVERVAEWCRKNSLSLKLYYMIGLPGEKIEELEMIAEQVHHVWKILGNRERVRVSLTPFTPKPSTPLWEASMETPDSLIAKINLLRRKIGGISRLTYYSPRKAYLQYRINRLGRDAYKYIYEISGKIGAPGVFPRSLDET